MDRRKRKGAMVAPRRQTARHPLLILGFFWTVLLPACATQQLLKKSDYASARQAFETGGPAAALNALPAGEGDTFIPLMEKTYLNLLLGRPDIDSLRDYARRIDDRVKYRVSREFAFLFYVETPEGYYASEHEIIWMHMLLSWGYSLRSDYERAAIEAKKSALLLEGKSKEGRFDDPMIRVVLGVLWAMCGRWEDARVDFRVAARLEPKLKWAATLAGLDAPPEQIALVLTGSGPEPFWDPRITWNPIRGWRDLQFEVAPDTAKLRAFDHKRRSLPVHSSPDSATWYRRHLVRDNAIHNLIADSQYGELALVSTAKAGLKSTFGVVLGTTIVVLSIGVGAAIIYYGGSAEAAELGLIVMAAGSVWGYRVGADIVEESYTTARRELDISDRYRYVRFLPDHARVIFGRGARPLRVLSGRRTTLVEADVKNESEISIRHLQLGP